MNPKPKGLSGSSQEIITWIREDPKGAVNEFEREISRADFIKINIPKSKLTGKFHSLTSP